MKSIAISQSNYLPWSGYFKLIDSVDDFVFFDEVQYTRRDWRNRNIIKSGLKTKWLTLSVENKGNYKEKIDKIKVSNKNWLEDHLQTLEYTYKKYPYFNLVKELLLKNLNKNELFLSKINQKSIIAISKFLGIKTNFYNSTDDDLFNKNYIDASTRLAQICKLRKADIYVSGPSAKKYLNLNKFNSQNIEVKWFNYNITGQVKVENLSIIHMLMQYGNNREKILNL